MKTSDFAGRTVHVVGGSLGIGLAIAKRAAGLGAHVVVFARRREPLEQAAAEISAVRKTATQKVANRQLDVVDPLQVSRVMEAAVTELGCPDVLVNCAGGAQPRRFEDISFAQFDQTMRLNVYGTWNVVQALLPHMKARGGYIVNTSSLAGLMGVFGYTDYCASKFALVGFSEALRSELKPYGIAVSVLCPPDTDTPGLESENATKPEETRAIAATAKVMSADAVAAALFRGMAKRRFLIIPGAEGKVAALAKRLFPGLVERTMDRTIRAVAKRRARG